MQYTLNRFYNFLEVLRCAFNTYGEQVFRNLYWRWLLQLQHKRRREARAYCLRDGCWMAAGSR